MKKHKKNLPFQLLLIGLCYFSTSFLNMPFLQAQQDPEYWDQLHVSVDIQEYVETIAYEQTDLLCYSYGQLMSDLKTGNENSQRLAHQNSVIPPHYKNYKIPPYYKDYLDEDMDKQIFWQHFFSDAQFRRSLQEWMFLNGDALRQAFQNQLSLADMANIQTNSDQPTIWNRLSVLVLGPDQQNTHSFWAKYTQYVMYLTQSDGFETAIRHCAYRYGLTEAELQKAMTDTILSYNHNTGVATGAVAFAAAAYVGWYAFPLVIRGFVSLARGLKHLWMSGYRLLRGQPQTALTPQQQQVVQTQIEEVSRRWILLGLGLETSFVIYRTDNIRGSIAKNQEQLPKKHLEIIQREARSIPFAQNIIQNIQQEQGYISESDRLKKQWWEARLNVYEKLIDRSFILERLREINPDASETLKAKRELDAYLDFYLMDYGIIERSLADHRQEILAFEKRIEDLAFDDQTCDRLANDLMARGYIPPGQTLDEYLCSLENHEYTQDDLFYHQDQLLKLQHSREHRIQRQVFSLLRPKKHALEDASYLPHLADRVLSEILTINQDRDYGLCRENIDVDEYDSYDSPFCYFYFLHTRSRLVELKPQEISRLQRLTDILTQAWQGP